MESFRSSVPKRVAYGFLCWKPDKIPQASPSNPSSESPRHSRSSFQHPSSYRIARVRIQKSYQQASAKAFGSKQSAQKAVLFSDKVPLKLGNVANSSPDLKADTPDLCVKKSLRFCVISPALSIFPAIQEKAAKMVVSQLT